MCGWVAFTKNCLKDSNCVGYCAAWACLLIIVELRLLMVCGTKPLIFKSGWSEVFLICFPGLQFLLYRLLWWFSVSVYAGKSKVRKRKLIIQPEEISQSCLIGKWTFIANTEILKKQETGIMNMATPLNIFLWIRIHIEYMNWITGLKM